MKKNKKSPLMLSKPRQRLGISLEAVVKKQRKRGKSLRLLGGLLATLGIFASGLVALAIGFTWLARKAVFENEKFNLVHVEIETSGSLRRDQVLEWADIPSRANLVALDIHGIRERLMTQSEIGEARVMKILPNRLSIKVTERRPIARVVTNVIVGQGRALMYALDRNGVVMSPRPGEDFMRLPEITGASLTDVVPGEQVKSQAVMSAIQLLAMLETSRIRPKLGRPRVDVSAETTLRLSTPGGGWVVLSRDAATLDQQIERLDKIVDHASKESKRIKSADLTVARNVPVVFVNN